MKTKLVLLFLFISTIVFAQNGQKSITEAIEFVKNQKNSVYFEVSEEMFKMMSEAEGVNPEYKEYMSKLSTLKMVRANQNFTENMDLYDVFMLQTNLKEFSMLMTSTEPRNKISFYKKSKNSENEFLLVSNMTILYITGTINIKSLQEFENIMEIAGSAMEI